MIGELDSGFRDPALGYITIKNESACQGHLPWQVFIFPFTDWLFFVIPESAPRT